MRKTLMAIISATLVATLAGCAAPSASADEVRSEKPREAFPDVAAEDLNTLNDGNNAFAFDLYHQIVEGSDNLFYSPYSISIALGMTYAGARNETEQQMAQAMHFELPQAQLHTAFNSLDQELNARGEGAQGKDGEGFRLNIVNAIWGQKNYSFLPDFLDTLARNYGAGLRVLDFQGAPDPSRIIINDWVEQQTEDRIQDLIPQGAINVLTRLVLTNAVYFNAAWESQFKENSTSAGPFHLLDGAEVSIPMMRQTSGFRYASGGDFEAVELPYDGHELSMVILLPAAGHFESFEDSLDYGVVESAIDGLQGGQVALTMPRFKMETDFNLNDALSALGMSAAFDPPSADFSGMDGGRDLHISDVIHKAFVDVDEAGTEAAAATAVIMEATSAPVGPVQVTIDRPFIFLIRDIETSSILFVGRVMNPE